MLHDDQLAYREDARENTYRLAEIDRFVSIANLDSVKSVDFAEFEVVDPHTHRLNYENIRGLEAGVKISLGA
jgi:hypothetical protein